MNAINNINAWVNKFNTQYKKVFNEDGTVKACGRNECKKLIDIASKNKEFMPYGDDYTGRMNIDNMNKLYNSINVTA